MNRKTLVFLSMLLLLLMLWIRPEITVSQESRVTLDLYSSPERFGDQLTQYIGEGPGEPCDALTPDLNTTLYARVLSDGAPEAHILVAFEVFDNQNRSFLSRVTETDEDGIASTLFRVPTQNPPEQLFGEWFAFASAKIKEVKYNDTMPFKVGYLITILDVVMTGGSGPSGEFVIGMDRMGFNVTLKNIALMPREYWLVITVYDGGDVPIIKVPVAGNLGPEFPYCNLKIDTVEITAPFGPKVPDWAYVGAGKVYFSVFTELPSNFGVPYSPEVIHNFLLRWDPDPITITYDLDAGEFVIGGLTVETDEANYQPGEEIEVYGNLIPETSPYQALLALQVNAPSNPIVVRTLEAGTTPPTGNISILDVITCDSDGNPKESFKRGATWYSNYLYVKITVANNDTTTRDVFITVNSYDKDMVTLGVAGILISVIPGAPSFPIIPIPIPSWASLGNGTVYASAFTDLPEDGGTPYCTEKLDTFQIVNSPGETSQGTQASITSSTVGNYSLTFKLPLDTATGVYRVYVSTFYLGRYAANNTVFGVNTICVPDQYPTIQEAVDVTSPTNDTIIVAPGIYNEHVNINKPLTLVGKYSTTTVINGGGTGTVVTIVTDGVAISRFTIENGGSLPNSGINLQESTGIAIKENIVTSNNGYGIYLWQSTDNRIYHNNFVNNTNQVSLYQSSSIWDDGAGKGNYWSDYGGQDLDGNEVGDTLLPHQGVDWYPLMKPLFFVRDLKITNVTPVLPYDVDNLYPGWVITVNVTVKNEGDFTETSFSLTAYYGENIIEMKNVSELTPREEITIGFTWTTVGVPYGNYTISAAVVPVPGETYTINNICTDDWILVTIPGDVSGNCRVDVIDQRLLQRVMLTEPGDPYWNPNVDIDANGRVDVIDHRIQQLHMFESW